MRACEQGTALCVLKLVVIGLDYGDLWRLEDFDPSRRSSLMRSFHAPWWVVGGKALELWMGRQTCATRMSTSRSLGTTCSSFTRPSVGGLGTMPMSVGPWAAAEVAAHFNCGSFRCRSRRPSRRGPSRTASRSYSGEALASRLHRRLPGAPGCWPRLFS